VVASNISPAVVSPAWRCYSSDPATAPACGVTASTCTAGSATAPVVTADNTTVTAVGCQVNFTPANPGTGPYTLPSGPTSIIPNPAAGTFSPAGSNNTNAANYWNGGTATSFTFDTATTAATTKIRFSTDGTTVPSCVGAVGAGVTEVSKAGPAPALAPAAFT